MKPNKSTELRALFVMLALCLVATPILCKDKKRDWQTGKLVSIKEAPPKQGPIFIPGGAGGLAVPTEYEKWIYVVETDTMVYEFSAYTGAFVRDRPHPFVIGSEVKFALDPEKKERAYLIDEEGKEFKVSVLTKTAKQQPH
jgi:hypothetical protein